MEDQAEQRPEKDSILRRNPQVDTLIVKQHKALDVALQKLGVDTKPRFNIEPPLGGDRLRLFNE
jgi:hypothetical protein